MRADLAEKTTKNMQNRAHFWIILHQPTNPNFENFKSTAKLGKGVFLYRFDEDQ